MTPRKNVADIRPATKNGRLVTSVSLSPRGREMLDRAGTAECVSFSALLEGLLLKHCRQRGLLKE
jgi:hypothetical protein